MADEKAMLSQWNTAFKKKLDKRTAAPDVTPTAFAAHTAALVAAPAATTPAFDFFATWDAYYPRLVSLLGWGSWLMPRKVSDILKALLSFVNDKLIPFAKEMMGQASA